MASTPLLVFTVLAGMAASMIPPCLPELGLEFCPSTAATAPAIPEWPPASVAYPDQMHQEKVLQDLVFPRIVKERMYNNTEWMATPVPPKGIDTFDEVQNSTQVVTYRYILNETPQQSFITKFLPQGNWNKSQDVIIIGAHIDSINVDAMFNGTLPEDMIAPGADDNASGFAVVLETLKVLSYLFAQKRPMNEVQFHF
ncbi:hypothetical protein N0V82_010708 [Gnomoniopsis sp. IMI 355080]|nr:hypothetical protein N0V82_010708 [Gnomoniopsis sp. IMI 355080]